MIGSILLVEDNAVDRDLTARAFDRCKVFNRLQFAQNGDEVFLLMDQWAAGGPVPVFILLDLNLPGISGLEILQCLKSHLVFKLIPVIMLTSSFEDRDVVAAYKLGANSYLVKPVCFERFTELVGRIAAYWCGINTSPN